MLYALEMTQENVDRVLATSWAADIAPQNVREFTTALVRGVVAHHAEIDALIQTASLHGSLERIGLVERNILRVAIYELM